MKGFSLKIVFEKWFGKIFPFGTSLKSTLFGTAPVCPPKLSEQRECSKTVTLKVPHS